MLRQMLLSKNVWASLAIVLALTILWEARQNQPSSDASDNSTHQVAKR
jgi:hypothetical protein